MAAGLLGDLQHGDAPALGGFGVRLEGLLKLLAAPLGAEAVPVPVAGAAGAVAAQPAGGASSVRH
eukprot:2778840-Lingulodinium_polyedra.AAC.1